MPGDFVGAQHPHLLEVLARVFPGIGDDEASETPASDVAAVLMSRTASATPFVNSANSDCPFCSMQLAGSTRPIAVLSCGHAYHISCGSALLQVGEGKECFDAKCHRDADVVVADNMREAVAAAVERGEFSLSDLNDPVIAHTVRAKISQIMRKAGLPGMGDAAAKAVADAAEKIDARDRTIDSYRARWLATDVGRSGLGLKHRLPLLLPYMNAIKAARFSDALTMETLYRLEGERRRATLADDREDTKAYLTGTVSESEKAANVSEPDEAMMKNVSLDKMIKAGLHITDIYFALGMKTWQGLRGLGISKAHITSENGAVPLVALMDLYGVNFKTVREDLGILADDLASARLSSEDLRRAKVHFSLMWIKMGLNKSIMKKFRFSPSQWCTDIMLQKKWLLHPIELNSADLIELNWTPSDVECAFGLHEIEMRRILGISESVPAVAEPTAPAAAAATATTTEVPGYASVVEHKGRVLKF